MTTTTTTASASTSKSTMKQPKSRVVTLHLSPDSLAKFPSDQPASTKSTSSSSTNSNPPPSNPVTEPSPSAGASDSNATTVQPTSTNNNLLAPPPNVVRRKGIPGPKPGMKRNASQMAIDSVPKPRGKPGPKKKPRPGETVNGAGVVAPTAPKLGPKANQGAINAHLRALDRTGKPCRKWQRQGFKLRSFTGVAWNLPSWATQKKALQTDFAGDVKSDSSGGSSELKGIHESSAAPSDKSNSGADGDTPMLLAADASSPAPVARTANAE